VSAPNSPPEPRGASPDRRRRIGWSDVWHRAAPGANPYANLLSGLHPIVDLNTMEPLEVEDADADPPPEIMGEYASALVPGLVLRDDLQPLEITCPPSPPTRRPRTNGNRRGASSGPWRTRTSNLGIKSPLLYQLS
jgi:Cu2+-containing amine oxidase